jgi:hypothetical protein
VSTPEHHPWVQAVIDRGAALRRIVGWRLVIVAIIALAVMWPPLGRALVLLTTFAWWFVGSELLQHLHMDPFALLWFTLLLIGAAAGYQLDHIARDVRAIRQQLDARAGSEQNSHV